jgi:hypothetical protein
MSPVIFFPVKKNSQGMFTNIHKTMEQCKYEQTQKNHLGFSVEIIRNLYLLQNQCQKMQGGTKQAIGVFRY